ncbi:MAG: GerMN domain-containing protein [Acidimicrobiales bacterium]|jgi:spore germination protein GerM
MRRQHRFAVVALGAAALAVTASGCGIALQSTAQPFNVPANQFTSPTTLPSTSHPGQAVDVFFLTDSYLVASVRHLPRGKLTLDRELQMALNSLDAGPTSAEFRLGVTTALSVAPAATVTVIGKVADRVASVDLDSTFDDLDTTQLFQADGQIVFTLTQFREVDAVNLVLNGEKIAYLPDGGVIRNRSVNRADYRAIAPPTNP